MKQILFIALALVSFNAFADSDMPRPCAASGEVELLTKRGSETVYGHINRDAVQFTRYQDYIFGDYNGNGVSLDVQGNSIRGSIGNEGVRLDYRGGVARGFLICID